MAERTHLAFHHDSHLSTIQTIITSITPFTALAEENKLLFKDAKDDSYAITTKSTIFHPQGGGQPSDEGTMENEEGVEFTVQVVRMGATIDGEVLHFGTFSTPTPFKPSQQITQKIDQEKRLLYSRYHTAGHVLGAAVRHLVSSSVPNFDETKASHFPSSAACEFAGLIESTWKTPIQRKLDEYIEADMPVEIDWWDAADFIANGMERLIPDRVAMGMTKEEKFRVVKIVGAETYPCGGTHVDSTKHCGKTSVKKIGRSKGTSRVGYTLA
ncbi:6ec41e21-a6af-4115-b6d4-0ca634dd5495 [Sclerotinia trifoliorum]|uniref:6ec41e21-a6af-4115-b6d4-0ca634dd5495 n=1 Tax=Sclerotinia trifoliorum TaxID=28548 RepID=A0A8H2W307_9HELO|nr:6ec41e21-a6af-4115-b6d4-0ca634dd5495 [Sclerotinia trifoliorum]